MSDVEATVEPNPKCFNDGTVLANYKLPEVPVLIAEGVSLSLSDAKSILRQFLEATYPASLEKSPAADFEGMESIDMFGDDQEDEADWNWAD